MFFCYLNFFEFIPIPSCDYSSLVDSEFSCYFANAINTTYIDFKYPVRYFLLYPLNYYRLRVFNL